MSSQPDPGGGEMAVLLFLTSTRRFQLCKIPHPAPPTFPQLSLKWAIMQLQGFFGVTKIKPKYKLKKKEKPESSLFPAVFEADLRPHSSEVS